MDRRAKAKALVHLNTAGWLKAVKADDEQMRSLSFSGIELFIGELCGEVNAMAATEKYMSAIKSGADFESALDNVVSSYSA